MVQLLEELIKIEEVGGNTNVDASGKLSRKHLAPGKWEKMRVGNTLAVINERVAAALRTCAMNGKLRTNKIQYPYEHCMQFPGLMSADAMIASHLIKWMFTWYKIMGARNKSEALTSPGKSACERPADFNDMQWLSSDERVQHLEDSIRLIRDLRFVDFGKYVSSFLSECYVNLQLQVKFF